MTRTGTAAGDAAAHRLALLGSILVRQATACLLVMAAASFLLLNRLGDVRAPIWDEAYYLPSTARYHEGQVQFASHPPLGLMLIAAGDGLYGGNAGIDQRAIAAVKSIPAEAMPADYDYLGPRLAPALFGVIGAGLFFLLMLQLTGSTGAALMLSTLYLCDTALLGQFRAAHIDPFQTSFALAALLCAIRGLKCPAAANAAGFGFLVACTALVRATGIMLAPMGLFLLWPLLRKRRWTVAIRSTLAGGGGAVMAFVLVAVAHAWASPRLPDPATEAGRGDMAYLSPQIRAAGSIDPLDPMAVARMTADYARFIASDHSAMARADANGSHPWQWLIGSGAITYRWDAGDTHVATVAFLPNRAAWLLSCAGVLLGLVALRRRPSAEGAMLLTGWIASMAALIILDRERVLYPYAYLPSLMIGYALLARAWRASEPAESIARVGVAAVTLAFLVTAPLVYHWDVPRGYCQILLRECGK
ncbi:MAG: phospholipid carrier-dependent glycosyltransferase [Sphingobium sp.]